MRRLLLIGLGTLLTSAPACSQDTRPIHAYAALPAIGSTIPDFSFPRVGGGDVSAVSLRGAPALLAFWSTGCHVSRQVLGNIEAMDREYRSRGVRVVILAQNTPDELARFFASDLDHPALAAGGDDVQRVFDLSALAPERSHVRVEWALPLFLVIDAHGRVVQRDVGAYAFPGLRAALDSLLARRS